MGDMAEVFRDMAAATKARRKANTASSTNYLKAKGIEFTSHNAGAHLVIPHKGGQINFWPSTGLWHVRNSMNAKLKEGRGVKPLIQFIERTRDPKCQ